MADEIQDVLSNLLDAQMALRKKLVSEPSSVSEEEDYTRTYVLFFGAQIPYADLSRETEETKQRLFDKAKEILEGAIDLYDFLSEHFPMKSDARLQALVIVTELCGFFALLKFQDEEKNIDVLEELARKVTISRAHKDNGHIRGALEVLEIEIGCRKNPSQIRPRATAPIAAKRRLPSG